MHEASIAENIFNIVKEQAEQGQHKAITRIHIKVGKLTALVPDCLDFAFKAIARGSPLENTELAIQEVNAQGTCLECGATFNVDMFLSVCEACGSTRVHITGGEELVVESMDIE